MLKMIFKVHWILKKKSNIKINVSIRAEQNQKTPKNTEYPIQKASPVS
jgi:hypothetical protein